MKNPRFVLLASLALGALLGTSCTTAPTHRPPDTTPPPAATSTAELPITPSTTLSTNSNFVSVCSFNIQWLGQSTKRDNVALAELLVPYDIVVVQELIASPKTGSASKPAQQRAAAFFKEMADRGFSFVLSESDTGPTGPLGTSSSRTEWWVTFYRPGRVTPVTDVPHGFLASPLAANPDYDRVPYAFGFRTTNKHCDFVLISVHLNPDNRTRRTHELAAIGNWIAGQCSQQAEKDFVILGDTNIANQSELHAETPQNFISLNDACVATNVNPNGPKPYDQVMFNPQVTTEIDRNFGFHVVNLTEAMRPKWTGPGAYPGDPYQQNVFRLYYSDHDPVFFRIKIPAHDDD